MVTAGKIPTHIVKKKKVKLFYACGISNKLLNMIITDVILSTYYKNCEI